MAIRCGRCGAFATEDVCRTCELRDGPGIGAGRKPSGDRRCILKARQKAVARLGEATTDRQRAGLRRLIAGHDARLATLDASRVPPGWKYCPGCVAHVRLDEANWDRRSDAAGGGWKPKCRRCAGDCDPVARYPLTSPRARPGPKESDEARRVRLSREREREVVTLIRRYAAVRDIPGRDRDAAYNALALALRDHHIPVSDGERQWEWSKGLGEITSRLLCRVWRAPEDRHADPRRVARGDVEYRLDLDYDRVDTLAARGSDS